MKSFSKSTSSSDEYVVISFALVSVDNLIMSGQHYALADPENFQKGMGWWDCDPSLYLSASKRERCGKSQSGKNITNFVKNIQAKSGGGYPRLNPPLSCLELELMSYTVVRNVIVKWDVDQVYFLNGFCRTRPSKLSIHVYLCKTRKTDRHHFYPMANLCARDGEFRLKGKSFMTWIFFLPPVHLMFCAQKQ